MTEEEQEETQTPAEADGEDGGDEEPQGGPPADQLDEAPAYNPDDENLKDIKGG